jgi:hypothetical protein
MAVRAHAVNACQFQSVLQRQRLMLGTRYNDATHSDCHSSVVSVPTVDGGGWHWLKWHEATSECNTRPGVSRRCGLRLRGHVVAETMSPCRLPAWKFFRHLAVRRSDLTEQCPLGCTEGLIMTAQSLVGSANQRT